MADAAQFTVLVGDCVMQINSDKFFDGVPLKNIRKLLNYVFQEPWRNQQTAAFLRGYILKRAAEAKETWHDASDAFRDGYSYTGLRHDLTLPEKNQIEAKNRRLYTDVKHCKANYERWCKIQSYFENLQNRNI